MIVRFLHQSLFLLFTLSLPAAAFAAYSLDDWMTIAEVRSLSWSPDGRHLYFTSNAADSGTFDVFRVPARGGEPERLGRDEEGVRPEPKEEMLLSPDGRTIYYSAASYYSAFLNLYRMPAAGGPAERLTFNDAVIQTAPAISPDGDTLAFFARTGAGMKVYTLDLTNPRAWPVLLLPGKGEESFPVWSSKGVLAFQREGDIHVLIPGESSPRRVIDERWGGGNSDISWSPDGERIAFVNGRSGFDQIGVVEVDSGEVSTLTYAPVDHSDPVWSPDGRWLAYVAGDDSGVSDDIWIMRADGEDAPRRITRGSGKRDTPVWSPDGRQLALIESTSTRTRDIWIADVRSGELSQLTDSMGRVDPQTLSVAERVSWRAEDNLEIPAMRWLPPDFDASHEYPVIVRLHGHPGQWNHRFEMMTQYFVNQGYVVVAPNPRGSVGFGQGFHDLHIGDYGGAEFRDVMGVIPYLEAQGYVDMTRKVTWGGSGGGYMSMVIATEAPDVFQAQVIRAPVTDWKVLVNDRFGASARAWTATRTPARGRGEFGGSYEEIPEEYFRRSPVNFVEQVVVPQLLFHGLRDTNVLPRQSRLWVEAMTRAGKRELVDFVTFPDEDHGLRRYKATVRARLEKMEAFFAKHLSRE